MSEHQNTGKIENRLDGTTWYDQDYADNLQQENKQLEEKIKDTIKDLQENYNGDDYSLINVINILKSLLEE